MFEQTESGTRNVRADEMLAMHVFPASQGYAVVHLSGQPPSRIHAGTRSTVTAPRAKATIAEMSNSQSVSLVDLGNGNLSGPGGAVAICGMN